MDYESRKEGVYAVDKDNEYHPLFFLDIIILIDRSI